MKNHFFFFSRTLSGRLFQGNKLPDSVRVRDANRRDTSNQGGLEKEMEMNGHGLDQGQV